MKVLLTVLVSVLAAQSNVAFAGSLEAVDCKKEMIAAALSKNVKDATLDSLLKNRFEVTDFAAVENDAYDYAVTVESTSRVDSTTVALGYGVKVLNVKKCKVKAELIAE